MSYIEYPHQISYRNTRLISPVEKMPDKNRKLDSPYSREDEEYIAYLQRLLTDAKNNRDQKWAEFSHKTYLQQFEENEKIAHTFLEPTKNDNEKKISTGSIESKLSTVLAHIDNLNLKPEVMAYDRNDSLLVEHGTALTDIMDKTAEHDGGDDGGDDEKKKIRQLELLKQGTVFVQDDFITKYEIKKKLKSKYKGEFKDFDGYEEKLEKVFEGCSRQKLYGPNVYLGDITAFSMNDQPYVFTVEQMDWRTAKTLYGQFENFQYVNPGVPTHNEADVGGRTIYDAKFRLTELKDNQVEIVKYQCPSKDEYQIMINGHLMLPAGFPLSAVTPGGRYNISKQTLYVINSEFAYGKSFVSSGSVYELSTALDRMLRLFELKTRKSVSPPYINNTNRVIPAKVLDPGNISMGLSPGALTPIGTESQGVTSSEYQIFRELQSEIERSTVSAVFQGQQAKSGATATEILEVQRQARLTLGLIISACNMLEVKCGYLRLWSILNKWMEPIGKNGDGSNQYRSVSREVNLKGVGKGERKIMLWDEDLPSPEVVRQLSLEEQKKKNKPVRRIYISPRVLRNAEIKWYVVVNASEKESSAYHKIQFREMLQDAAGLINIGARPNLEGITDEFAKVYSVDKSKVFSNGEKILPQQEGEGLNLGKILGNSGGAPSPAKQPQPKPKT